LWPPGRAATYACGRAIPVWAIRSPVFRAFLAATPAHGATTFTVTRNADGGANTLRQAIRTRILALR
jgi:hypothetical protein